MHIVNLDSAPSTPKEDINNNIITEDLDIWILSKLYEALRQSTESFKQFDYSRARAHTEDFFWNDFCDNYLEL